MFESLDYISIFCIGLAAVFFVLAIISLVKQNGKVKKNLGFTGGLLFLMFFNFLIIEGDKQDNKKTNEFEDAYVEHITDGETKMVGEELKVGNAVNFEGLRVRVNSVRIEKGGEYDEKENDQFLVFNITAENTSNKEIEVNSYSNLELYDGDGYRYDEGFLSEGIQGNFYGKILPKGKLRADIAFDVPKNEQYKFHYKNGEYGREEIAVWDISVSDIQKK